MEKWIYLKSNNPADALALASVIAVSNNRYKIVRRSILSQFFTGMDNVVVDFYVPGEESELVVIEGLTQDSWYQKCSAIANILNEEIRENYLPYTSFVGDCEPFKSYLAGKEVCGLFLYPQLNQNLDLILVDNIVRLFEHQGVKSASCGSLAVTCIKGTMDFRHLIDMSLFTAILPSFRFVITTEESIATICEAFHKSVFVIKADEHYSINGHVFKDPNQIVNYINLELSNI